MNVWFSQTIVQDTGWTLVHFLWQGLVIAGLLAGAWRVMRKTAAHYRYLAGCAAMLLMAVAPLVTFRLVTARDEAPALADMEVATATQPPVEIAPRPASAKPVIVVTATPVARVAGSVWRVERIFPWVVAGWLVGVVALSGRLLAGWWEVRRLRRESAVSLGGHLQEKMAELARRLGIERPLRLLESALVEVPTVIGWLRPVILLPATCLTGLSPAQLEAILAHELAHVRRHDYLVNLLQSAVETLLFYHPAVWWVSRRVREERENCCDDLAVGVCGDRVGYARALATLEELRLAPAQVALAAGGAPLLQRVRRLLGQTERSAGRPAWPVAGIIAVLLAAVFAAGMRNQPAEAAQKTPVMARTNAQSGSPGLGATNASNATARAAGENTATNRPAAATANLPERIPVSSQAGRFNWNVDGQNQLNQQWFWYRVGSSNSAGGTNSASTSSGGESIVAQAAPDGYIPQGWPNQSNAPALATLTGILTDPQFHMTFTDLEQGDGVEVQTPAEVTTSTPAGATYRDPWGQPYLIALDQAKPGPGESARQSAPTRMRYDAPETGDTNSRNGDYYFTTGGARQAIISKLNSIRVESVKYPGVPLREIITNLKEIAQKRDPSGEGINFLMDREEGKPDVGDVKVTMELTNVRLADVLDAITKTADRPIKYAYLDYAVVFSLRQKESPGPLEVRAFHVEPRRFRKNLEEMLANITSVISVADHLKYIETLDSKSLVDSWFSTVVSDASTNSGKVVVYNESKGILTVRATAQDLDLIEAAIQTIKQPSAQINMKIKFMELAEGTNGAGAANALLDTLMKAGMVMQFSGAFTNGVPAAVTIAESLKAGTFVGTMKESQYRDLLRELEQRDGVEILSAPEVTTENGRQAQVQAVRMNATLPTPPPVTTIGGGRVAGPDAVQSGQAPGSAVPGTTASAPATMYTPRSTTPPMTSSSAVAQSLPLGPTLDIIPYISADELSVQMTLTPSLMEFMGYGGTNQFVLQAALPTGQTITSVLPLPHFQVRPVSTNVAVWDGQTVVMGGLRSESAQKAKKKLLIFITPTIINPDGTRVNAEGK